MECWQAATSFHRPPASKGETSPGLGCGPGAAPVHRSATLLWRDSNEVVRVPAPARKLIQTGSQSHSTEAYSRRYWQLSGRAALKKVQEAFNPTSIHPHLRKR